MNIKHQQSIAKVVRIDVCGFSFDDRDLSFSNDCLLDRRLDGLGLEKTAHK